MGSSGMTLETMEPESMLKKNEKKTEELIFK